MSLRNIRMPKLDKVLLRSKFRGCMLGSLLGDCLGAPFEGDPYSAGEKLIVQRYFDKLDGTYLKVPMKQYTDDTAMTKCVAQCLIEKPAVDFKHLAKLFVIEYFREPKRGYGQNVVNVFHKLRKDKFSDIYKPAIEQFQGSGSFGNGGAMRVAPIALYFHNDYNSMINAASKATEITHTNKLGIHGSLLQCIAVHQSLLTPSTSPIDINTFTDGLIDKMEQIETDDGLGLDGTPYQDQLKLMKQMLCVVSPDNAITDEEVIGGLGTSIDALHSVPTAIYCFLRAQSEIAGIDTNNVIRRTIQYAISLGGDTDTIASMAGSIAGAHLGAEHVGVVLRSHCEYHTEMQELADNLYNSHPTSN